MEIASWSHEIAPNMDYAYDHVLMETPLGKAVIEWKSWKRNPDYGVTINDDYIETKYSLPEAKACVKEYLILKNTKLTNFLASWK